MSTPRATVYIVEDDPSFRKSMERLIRASGYEVVACDSASAFLAQASVRRPGCLLLDVQLPDCDGLRFQKELVQRGIRLPVVFMTGYGTIPMSVQAMKDGAVDFLPKPFETKDLLGAIARALERDIRDVQEQLQKDEIAALMNSLTPREREVLRWVIAGKLNKQIADALGTTERTIKAHRAKIMQKTGASSVADLVRMAEKADISPAD